MSVVVQAERHIPVDFQDIYSIVKGNMSISQRQQFEEVCQLIESLYAQDFMTLRRNLKRNFKPFSVGAKGQKLQTRVGKALPPKADLDGKELHLVSDFIQLMARARFQIMTKEEWEQAKLEKFKFQLPVAVDWTFFDKKLLSAYWNSSNEAKRFRMLLPEWADRCLVFKRDVMVMEDTGRYISEKIDLLISYALIAPLLWLWRWICAKVFRRPVKSGSAGSATTAGGEEGQARHKNARVVERRSLKRLMPTLWSLLLGFVREFTIQEPAYKQVVVLYRAAPAGSRSKDKKAAKKRSKDDRLTDILSNRNIHIKAFHDIPMADLEMVFPEKKPYLKMMSIINMIISTVMVLVGVVSMLFKDGKGFDFNALMSVGSLVSARFFQMYSSMQAELSECTQEMNNLQYDKTDDAQEGVVSMLLEDMAEQQLKETVIAYILLHLGGEDGGLKLDELDRRCEDWLEEHFSLKVDFAVEDALPRLLEWRLLTQQRRNGEVIYNAVPVSQAHDVLVQRWSRAFEALGKPPKVYSFPLTSLLADPNTELPPLFVSVETLLRRQTIARAKAEALAAAEAEADKQKKLAHFVETESGFKAVIEKPVPVVPDLPAPGEKEAEQSSSAPKAKRGLFGLRGRKQQVAKA